MLATSAGPTVVQNGLVCCFFPTFGGRLVSHDVMNKLLTLVAKHAKSWLFIRHDFFHRKTARIAGHDFAKSFRGF